MTLNEIAYNALNLIRGGLSNQDEHISLEQLKFNIKYYRAMFIRRDFNRNGLITRHVEQDLGCLDLIRVDAARCCSIQSGCVIYRTTKKIPRTVRFQFQDAITYVGDVTGVGRIPLVSSSTVQWLPYDKYTAKQTKAFMIEDYLYIYEPKGLEYVNVRGVFEDPEELKNFDCDSGDCYDDNSEFPLPMDMVQMITQGLLSGELQIVSKSPNDTENDRAQDPEQGKIG